MTSSPTPSQSHGEGADGALAPASSAADGASQPPMEAGHPSTAIRLSAPHPLRGPATPFPGPHSSPARPARHNRPPVRRRISGRLLFTSRTTLPCDYSLPALDTSDLAADKIEIAPGSIASALYRKGTTQERGRKRTSIYPAVPVRNRHVLRTS